MSSIPEGAGAITEMRSSAEPAGVLSAPARWGPRPGPAHRRDWSPHHREASCRTSLQHFGGGVQARLPPALGTLKEAELWGDEGRSKSVRRCLPVLLSPHRASRDAPAHSEQPTKQNSLCLQQCQREPWEGGRKSPWLLLMGCVGPARVSLLLWVSLTATEMGGDWRQGRGSAQR